MPRSEEAAPETCVDCGASVLPGQDDSYGFSRTGALCAECARQRGGRYDVERDLWDVVPDYADLEEEFH